MSNTRGVLRPTISIEDARAVMALVDCGTHKDAALALNISGPTLTARISRLEERVGFPVLEVKRVPGSCRFSVEVLKSGENVVDYCRNLLAFVARNESQALLDGRDRQRRGLERSAHRNATI